MLAVDLPGDPDVVRPGRSRAGPTKITDVKVTPFGTLDLSSVKAS